MSERKGAVSAERRDRLLLSFAFVCGMSLPSEAGAAEAPRSPELLRPLSAEQLKEVAELKETSPLAKEVDAIPDAVIRQEGYQGDILTRKMRAKSQIPLLHGIRWAIFPGDNPKTYPHPLVNVDIFTRGAFIYFDIPDDENLRRGEVTSDDLESITSEIRGATEILTTMPARRVNRREDANLVVYFVDHDLSYWDYRTNKRSEGAIGLPDYKVGNPIPFFPMGTIYPIIQSFEPAYKGAIEPDYKGGVRITLTSYVHYREAIKSRITEKKILPGFDDGIKFIHLKGLVNKTIHEIGHFIGYGHSNEIESIVHPHGNSRYITPDFETGKRREVIGEGASVYTDKNGYQYGLIPGWGDLKKSPIVDLNFFLRIFAKMHKEKMEEEQRKNRREKTNDVIS